MGESWSDVCGDGRGEKIGDPFREGLAGEEIVESVRTGDRGT